MSAPEVFTFTVKRKNAAEIDIEETHRVLRWPGDLENGEDGFTMETLTKDRLGGDCWVLSFTAAVFGSLEPPLLRQRVAMMVWHAIQKNATQREAGGP